MKTTFDVEKMFCEGCAKHVVDAVQAAQPGAEVNVELATGKVEVSPSPAIPDVLVKAIADAGYAARLSATP